LVILDKTRHGPSVRPDLPDTSSFNALPPANLFDHSVVAPIQCD